MEGKELVIDAPPVFKEGEAARGFVIAALPAYNEEVAIGSLVLMAKEHVDKVIV